MGIPKTKLIILLAASALFIQACSTAQSDEAVNVQSQASVTHTETVKPGAAISISYTKPKTMTAGQFIPISLVFDEQYDTGTMQVKITPSKELSLFGNLSQKSFPMAEKSKHEWPIDVSAAEDGIYFLNIFAIATDQNLNISSQRSFSVRLDVGDITASMKAKAFPENGKLSSDGSMRILEAQETIQ